MRGLDRRIDIERRSSSVDEAGQPLEAWSKIVTRRSAAVLPVRGDERFTAQQFIARQQTEFRVRFSASVRHVNPLDRIIYPAADVGSPADPGDGEIYDIIEVRELGRREGLRIFAARRAEIDNV